MSLTLKGIWNAPLKSLKIWNAPITLKLEAVALVEVKAGQCCGFRASLGFKVLLWVSWHFSFPGSSICFFFGFLNFFF